MISAILAQATGIGERLGVFVLIQIINICLIRTDELLLSVFFVLPKYVTFDY